MIAAVKEVGLQVPLVVRLEGTNVDLGKKILRNSGLNVIAADDLDDAAQKIVNAVQRPDVSLGPARDTGPRPLDEENPSGLVKG